MARLDPLSLRPVARREITPCLQTISFAVDDPSLRTGFHRIELETRAPLFADLTIQFDAPHLPPMVRALDPAGDRHYAAIIHIGANGGRVCLTLTPAESSDSIVSLAITRLTANQLAQTGLERVIKNLRSPRLLLAKLRQVATGRGNISLSSPHTASPPADSQAAYDAWREAFEAPALRDKLIASLGEPPTVLALHVTGSRSSLWLTDHLTSDLFSTCRLKLAVAETPDYPLPAPLREAVQRSGGAILPLGRTDHLMSTTLAHAQTVAATAFVVLDGPGSFADLALASCLCELARHPRCLAVYGDSDTITTEGRRTSPRFNPDWSPEYALACDYVGQAVMFRVDPAFLSVPPELANELALSYGLLLHMSGSVGSQAIRHVPAMLFHRAEAAAEPTACAARLRAKQQTVTAFLEQSCSLAGDAKPPQVKQIEGIRRIDYPLPATPPLVSVIIPSKDNPDLLRKAAHAVLDADYPWRELVIVDNGSRLPAHRELIADLATRHKARVVSDDRPFNFSGLVNAGRRASTGEVLVLLNDDIEALDARWLDELVTLAIRPGIGCVGPLLLYPDRTVQHAGVFLGWNGAAGHAFRHQPETSTSCDRRLHVRHEVSAVTGACLAVTTTVFDRLGGFDESLPVTWNDVDFCLKAREQRLRNLYTPYARLIHHESRTRGLDATPAKLARLASESARFLERWGEDVLRDPYYSPHLSSSTEDFRPRPLS